jgi:protein gp37
MNPNISAWHRLAYEGQKPILDEKELEAPLRLKKPARIGVQFMGDLFHEDIPDSFVVRILNVAFARANKHQYFFLTKRPERMEHILQRVWLDSCGGILADKSKRLWLGVSVEDQQTADERIPILLQIPAAKRFVSVEPMLGPVKLLYKWLSDSRPHLKTFDLGSPAQTLDGGIDWVVCGGESGPKARPIHPDWVRSLKNQSQAAGVPFFFKGWGEWSSTKPELFYRRSKRRWSHETETFMPDGYHYNALKPDELLDSNMITMYRVGKKKAGRLLDGKIWDETPK